MKKKKTLGKKKGRGKKLRLEELESRVALSVPDQKKSYFPIPYMPGTDYGLIKRANLKKSKKRPGRKKLEIEALEKRVALSVPDQKKSYLPVPYMPGTYYGLVKRSNL